MSMNKIKIDKKKFITKFVKLAEINSPSFKEGEVASCLKRELKKLGCRVTSDNAHKNFGGETGNIIAKFPGTIKAKPRLLIAHMDSFASNEGLKLQIKANRIISDGKNVLGADGKVAVAAILGILDILEQNKDKLKYPPLEIIFAVAEEKRFKGSKYLNYSLLKAKEGILFDTTYPDKLILKTPAKYAFEAVIYGIPAHAGWEPEKGISAIEIASQAVSKMNLRRIDFETTANIGIMKGGTARNVVMPKFTLYGEVRGHNVKKLIKQLAHIKKCFQTAVKNSRKKVDGKFISAKLKFTSSLAYPAAEINKTEPIVQAILDSAKKQNIPLKAQHSDRASAICRYMQKGIKTPSLSYGQRNVHTKEEYLDLKDYFNAVKIALTTILSFKK